MAQTTTATTADRPAPGGGPQPLHPLGRLWACVAVAEALTWVGLLAGMYLKYVTGTTELVVTVFGSLHGAAFLVHAVVTLVAARRLRWGWWRALVALACSVPPLLTLLAEWWLYRTGYLADPAARDQGRASAAA